MLDVAPVLSSLGRGVSRHVVCASSTNKVHPHSPLLPLPPHISSVLITPQLQQLQLQPHHSLTHPRWEGVGVCQCSQEHLYADEKVLQALGNICGGVGGELLVHLLVLMSGCEV